MKQRIKVHKILIVLPTYNNAAALANVIADVELYTDDVLVVNDGSTDNTLDIIASKRHITYAKNRGKGYAIKQAIQYAAAHDYRYILTMDTDGQHFASDIEQFVDAIDENPDTLIIGARNLNAENMPSKNTFANKFSNFWYKVETGKTLYDTQSGFRLYPVEKLAKMNFFTNRYEFEVESIVRANWKGIKVINIPITVYYPPAKERISHFKPGKDFFRISVLNTVLVLFALLYYYPFYFIKNLTRANISKFIKTNITQNQEPTVKIASAIGLGFFFGIFPIWGYQMVVAAFVAHFLKLNKVLALVCSNISIPPMIPFILYGSYWTGAKLLNRSVSLHFSSITLEQVSQDLLLYLIGAVVLSFIVGIATFLLSLLLLTLFRSKHKNG